MHFPHLGHLLKAASIHITEEVLWVHNFTNKISLLILEASRT